MSFYKLIYQAKKLFENIEEIFKHNLVKIGLSYKILWYFKVFVVVENTNSHFIILLVF